LANWVNRIASDDGFQEKETERENDVGERTTGLQKRVK